MGKKYKNLSSPLKIGSITIKNRMCVAPMDTGAYSGPQGDFSKEGIDYFVRRAQGGFGLIYSGGQDVDSIVDPVIESTLLQAPAVFKKAGIELNTRLKAYGAHMFIQLSFGFGRNMPGACAPSELPVCGMPNMTSPEITKEQIKQKVDQMIQAAVLVKESGFSGVEIHAIHWGHLLDQFAMSITNKRTDEYGGSLDNRLRIARELVEEIKQACGKDFPVTMRLGLRSFMKDFGKASYAGEEEIGRTLEESIEIAKCLEAYGYDALSVDAGTVDSFYYACPPGYLKSGYLIDMASAVKKEVSIPVLVGGRMADADMSEKAIADGKIDGIALGRPSLADPDYAKKIMMDASEKIRPCIACNQGCIHRYVTVGLVYCAVNPEIGRDISYGITPALQKKEVVIVGGGVAGMEAARTAALRGHSVTLFEKTDRLGGNLIPAGKHEFKKEVQELNEWYQQEIKVQEQIEIKMQEEATPDKIKELNPDVVILAVGSTAVMPKLPGIEKDHVMSCVDALEDKKPIGQNVVIVGGGLVGCEMALEYIQQGKNVSIVEALDDIMSAGEEVPTQNKQMLLDAFEYYNTQIFRGHRLTSINDQGALVVDAKTGAEKQLEADTVIMSVGFRPNKSIVDKLSDTNCIVYELGDGHSVGNILTAVWDAYEVAHTI
ncbi:FAD-dependent oxidoreductase [Clostridium estertheticum]|uniref:FAD-dependent oxidoreductase n=1 Tax=Clostridium estertheticum TaxID=238834 RepID=UPI001C0C9CFE|nr:FAD-dependent oxidoreductase [Clostridium estertheticum]MBU3202411.1 FAD-dependent oxidoreductase [Clostridium estertheticum]WAG66622.1 FAD-dependent oxidoreductase [Clostridium estertheticum]